MQDKMAMKDQVMKKIGKAVKETPIMLKGWFQLDHIKEGAIIDSRIIGNTITNAGLAEVAGLLTADTAGSLTAFDYIAIGTGTTAADATDTQLEEEIIAGGGNRRGVGDVTGTQETTTVTNDTGQFVTTFTFTGTYAVTESGVFNATSTGDMLCRQTFSPINVASGDSLQITWKVQTS